MGKFKSAILKSDKVYWFQIKFKTHKACVSFHVYENLLLFLLKTMYSTGNICLYFSLKN